MSKYENLTPDEVHPVALFSHPDVIEAVAIRLFNEVDSGGRVWDHLSLTDMAFWEMEAREFLGYLAYHLGRVS